MERVTGNAGVNEGAQAVGGAAKLVMLLGGLDDGGEVDATKGFQLLGLLGDAVEVAQHFLQQLLLIPLAELWLLERIVGRLGQQALALGVVGTLGLDSHSQWLKLLLACRGAVAKLLRNVGDEVMHLFQLHIGQLVDKRALVIGGPGVVVLVVFEQLLELVVVNVFIFPWRIYAPAQRGSELHGLAKVEIK